MTTQVGIAVRTGVMHVHTLVYATRNQTAAQSAAEMKWNTGIPWRGPTISIDWFQLNILVVVDPANQWEYDRN